MTTARSAAGRRSPSAATHGDTGATPGSAGDALDEFLDLAGHELRTPITALKGQVQLLQRRLRKEPSRDADLADLGKMMYQIERLNHELDVYLEASHIARKRFDLLPAPSDLVAQSRRLVETFTAAANAHTLVLNAPDEQIVGTWDTRRLLMAIEALLTNALKFSRGGDIEVRVTRDGDMARVEVADRGIGVPSGERTRIFEAYNRGSNAENAGAGLGLYVVRETIRRHRGRVGMRARPGGGSVFWFTVPLAPVSSRRTSRSRDRALTRASGPHASHCGNTQATASMR